MDDLERLCRYLTNDSVVRWALGCSQAEINAMRKSLREPLPRTGKYLQDKFAPIDPEAEFRARVVKADRSNRCYIAALRKAHG